MYYKASSHFLATILSTMPVSDVQFHKLDPQYANLLRKQYRVITSKINEINHIANNVYKYTTEKKKFFTDICCDFHKLEEAIKVKKSIGLNPLQSIANVDLF